MKIYEYDVGHLTKVDGRPIYGKTLQRSRTNGPVSTKLGM